MFFHKTARSFGKDFSAFDWKGIPHTESTKVSKDFFSGLIRNSEVGDRQTKTFNRG